METFAVTQHWAVTYAAETGAAGVWARGDVELLDARPIVAITGARAATGYGVHVAAEIAIEAHLAGAHVATGGAYGIDAAAIRAVLAEGGAPIVWFAGGVDRAYPAAHESLFSQVLDAGGLLLSLQPDGVAANRNRFRERSLALGAFADLTIIVEAGARSGSLQVAGAALEHGRRVAAVPGPITVASSTGSNMLLADPRVDPVIAASDIADLLEADA